jgi:hypothetical protein
MDARNLVRYRDRIALSVLSTLIALGLWQGYGAWLFGRVH